MKACKNLLLFMFFGFFLYLPACHLNQTGGGDTSGGRATGVKADSDDATPSEKWLFTGSLELTNAAKYRSLLSEYRRCDPCTNYFGPAKCKHFDSRADVKIEFEQLALPAKAVLTIKPYSEKKFIWPVQGFFGACKPVNPLSPIKFEGKARYWSNYEGFHVQFAGSTDLAGGLGFVTVRSANGVPGEHSALNITLYYGGSAKEANIIGTSELEDQSRDDSDGYYGGRGGR